MKYNRHINWKPVIKNPKIFEIYTNGLEFALVSDNYEQCHNFMWCKDFLQSVLYAAIYNQCIEIYKFQYNPFVEPLPCLNKTRLLLTNLKDKKFSEKIPAVIDFINQIENKLKIKKTVARKCWNPPEPYKKNGVFLFEGSKRWIQAPPMISLYSLLLRVGFCHTVGNSFEETLINIKLGKIKPYQKKDSQWFKLAEPAFEKILRLGDRCIFHKDINFNYPRNLGIDPIHNKLGIIGFSTEMLYKSIGRPVFVPYWHRTA